MFGHWLPEISLNLFCFLGIFFNTSSSPLGSYNSCEMSFSTCCSIVRHKSDSWCILSFTTYCGQIDNSFHFTGSLVQQKCSAVSNINLPMPKTWPHLWGSGLVLTVLHLRFAIFLEIIFNNTHRHFPLIWILLPTPLMVGLGRFILHPFWIKFC